MADSTLKENTAAVRKLFGTAAKLAQKQAALATLNNVTLPKLYHAIGKKIVGLEKLPPDLVPHREKIRAFEAGINTKPEELPATPAEGFAAKAKHFAQQAAQKVSKATSDATATMQIQAAYVALGKEAVEKYGEKAVPEELSGELSAAKARLAVLSAEVEASRRASMTMPTGGAAPAALLYCGAWALPFMDHLGICNGAQVAWGVSSESWLGLFLVLLAHGCALGGLGVLLTRNALRKSLMRPLLCGLAACVFLNTVWFFSYDNAFFSGFYAWYACFLLIAVALWHHGVMSTPSRGSMKLRLSFGALSLVGRLALVFYVVSWTMPVAMILGDSPLSGWKAFSNALGGSWLAWLSALTNSVAVLGLLVLFASARPSVAGARVLLAGAIISICLNSLWIILFPDPLLFGFYLWFASFCLLALEAGRDSKLAGPNEKSPNAIANGTARYAVAGLLVGLLVVLPVVRNLGRAVMGPALRSSTGEMAAKPVARNAVANDGGAVSEERPRQDANAGFNAFIGMMAGMVAQQQAQQMQIQQQQERAAFRNQMRDIQTQYSRMPGPPQGGFLRGAGQGGGGGYRPQKMVQYEGTCNKCGHHIIGQTNGTSSRCRQITGPNNEPCSGVIVMTPINNF